MENLDPIAGPLFTPLLIMILSPLLQGFRQRHFNGLLRNWRFTLRARYVTGFVFSPYPPRLHMIAKALGDKPVNSIYFSLFLYFQVKAPHPPFPKARFPFSKKARTRK